MLRNRHQQCPTSDLTTPTAGPAYLDHLVAVDVRVAADRGEHLHAGRLVGAVGDGAGHLPVREGVGGVRPERQLGAEHGLTLQTGALSDEQVVVVALRGRPHTISDGGGQAASHARAQGLVLHMVPHPTTSETRARLNISRVEDQLLSSHNCSIKHGIAMREAVNLFTLLEPNQGTGGVSRVRRILCCSEMFLYDKIVMR